MDKTKQIMAEIDKPYRRSGRTTRIIDAAVQELFNSGRVDLIDHVYKPHSLRHREVLKIFVERLWREHSIPKNELTIKDIIIENLLSGYNISLKNTTITN